MARYNWLPRMRRHGSVKTLSSTASQGGKNDSTRIIIYDGLSISNVQKCDCACTQNISKQASGTESENYKENDCHKPSKNTTKPETTSPTIHTTTTDTIRETI